MGRHRDTGVGSLKQASGKWYVRFTTYQRGRPKQHCFQVGPTNIYDKEQARQLATEYVQKVRMQGGIKNKIGTGVALLPSSNLKPLKITAPERGATAELVVAADLQSKGYQVYLPVSPVAPCDMVAIDTDWNTFRVQVKRAVTSSTGAVRCDIRKEVGRFDLLAILLDDTKIEYRMAFEVCNLTYPLKTAQPTRGPVAVMESEATHE